MSESKVRASASVQVTVEVKADSVWGGDCKLDQVHQQARDDIEGQLRRVQDALREGNIRVTSIGPVKKIITREER
jgi:hypothetical protein